MDCPRPSQRPTLRAPALTTDPIAVESLPPPSFEVPMRGRRLAPAVVIAVAVVCGMLLGAAATLRLAGIAPTGGPAAVAATVPTVEPAPEPAASQAIDALATAPASDRAVPDPRPGADAPRLDPPVTSSSSRVARGASLDEVRGATSTPRPLYGVGRYPDETAVRRVIQGQQARLRQCYTTAVRHHGRATVAVVRLTLDIAPAGSVSGVEVEGASLPGMSTCLQRTAEQWSFPASRRGAQAPLSLRFSPADA